MGMGPGVRRLFVREGKIFRGGGRAKNAICLKKEPKR
jgi:hypothetical protein